MVEFTSGPKPRHPRQARGDPAANGGRASPNAIVDINIPEVQAEVEAAFRRYVEAISSNDIDTVTASFWDSPRTLRYAPGESLYGMDAIRAFRRTQRGQTIELSVTRALITTFGRDFGTANCEMQRSDTGRGARMSHTWVRLPEGWRIVAAHVSGPVAE